MPNKINKILQNEVFSILREKYGNFEVEQVEDGVVEILLLKKSYLTPGGCFEIVDTAEKFLKKSLSGIEKVVLINHWE